MNHLICRKFICTVCRGCGRVMSFCWYMVKIRPISFSPTNWAFFRIVLRCDVRTLITVRPTYYKEQLHKKNKQTKKLAFQPFLTSASKIRPISFSPTHWAIFKIVLCCDIQSLNTSKNHIVQRATTTTTTIQRFSPFQILYLIFYHSEKKNPQNFHFEKCSKLITIFSSKDPPFGIVGQKTLNIFIEKNVRS